MKIEDFGEKIGMARKDLAGGFTSDMLLQMNEQERRAFVKRDGVWPLPNAVRLVENGIPAFVVYWRRVIRRQVAPHPVCNASDTTDSFLDKCITYTDQVNLFRKRIESIKNEHDIHEFYAEVNESRTEFREKYGAILSVGDILGTAYDLSKMKWKCDRSGFPNASDKKQRKRKPQFIPFQLEHIEREGENYRHGLNISPERWQKDFNFRGVEFGNWMSQQDRRFSMNYAYDALRDLAYVLDIEDTDIAFGGKLALAFGARGCSHASAHYEPMREVINLTKMHGAGCTAHEWFHAMDDRLAKWSGITSGKLASEAVSNCSHMLPDTFVAAVKAMKYDKDGNFTDFYRGSKVMDNAYAKDSHGYWSSNCEMMARAFACYVKDTLGCKSDYLIAHADVYEFEYEDQSVCAHPQGEEREILDDLFDKMFFELKDIGFFTQRTVNLFEDDSDDAEPGSGFEPVDWNSNEFPELFERPNGQLCLAI